MLKHRAHGHGALPERHGSSTRDLASGTTASDPASDPTSDPTSDPASDPAGTAKLLVWIPPCVYFCEHTSSQSV